MRDGQGSSPRLYFFGHSLHKLATYSSSRASTTVNGRDAEQPVGHPERHP